MTIHIRRTEVRPFTEKQIALLETFADQAVIAIENVRLFKELQERNAELREALEHQTATAEVLGIISRSPTDVQPVLDAIVESAARVCGIDDVVLRLREGNTMVPRAHFGPIPIGRVEISIDEPQFRWMREHGTLHIPDVRAQNDFPTLGSVGGWRTFLSVPLRQQGELIGALSARRTEVRPFTPAQIKLLETFADQAVIAIENVRLFQELKESLEQQTATSEILGVIASSPTDIQPVLDVVAENAARLCDATDASDSIALKAICFDWWRIYGSMPVPESGRTTDYSRIRLPAEPLSTGRPIHVHDLLAEIETEFPGCSGALQQVSVTRTVLGRAVAARGGSDWSDYHSPNGSPSFLREADRAAQNLRRPSRHRHRERAACSRNSRSATQNCARRWSIRRQRPRCSASSAARRRTCSRCSTPSSRAPRGFVGLMMWCCDSARGTSWFCGLILVPYPCGRVEISIDEPPVRWMREHGTLHIPDVRDAETISQVW